MIYFKLDHFSIGKILTAYLFKTLGSYRSWHSVWGGKMVTRCMTQSLSGKTETEACSVRGFCNQERKKFPGVRNRPDQKPRGLREFFPPERKSLVDNILGWAGSLSVAEKGGQTLTLQAEASTALLWLQRISLSLGGTSTLAFCLERHFHALNLKKKFQVGLLNYLRHLRT